MDSSRISVTRRRLLAGVVAVGAAGAGAGAGTMALFADQESSTGNTVSAGTLDLTLDGSDATVQFLSVTDVKPGDSGQATLPVANAGSLTGYLDVEVAALATPENGIVGNENSVDSTPNQGELQNYLEVHAAFQNGSALWSGFDTVDNRLQPGTVYDLDDPLAAGGSDTFLLQWQLPSSAGEDAQSDGVEFALTFSLDQEPDAGA